MFIYLERERPQVGKVQRERGTEDVKAGSTLTAESPVWAWTHEPWAYDLSWSGMLNRVTPIWVIFNKIILGVGFDNELHFELQ